MMYTNCKQVRISLQTQTIQHIYPRASPLSLHQNHSTVPAGEGGPALLLSAGGFVLFKEAECSKSHFFLAGDLQGFPERTSYLLQA